MCCHASTQARFQVRGPHVREGVRLARQWGWMMGVVVVAGCGPQWEPLDYPVAEVIGHVRFHGEPVRGGWIEFHPQAPTVGHTSTAMIGRDGAYHARRVAVGTHRVQVVRTKPLLPRTYTRGGSPLTADVLAGRVNVIDFNIEPPSTASRPTTQPDHAATIRSSDR